MRWTVFALIALTAMILQTTVVTALTYRGVRPDWMVIVVVYIALHASRRDAVIGAWIIGVMADLMTVERFGLISLSFVLTGWAVASVREFLFRSQGLTQIVVTLLACLTIRTAWTIYHRLLYESEVTLLVDLCIGAGAVSVYTALWAPLLCRSLRSVNGALGLTKGCHSRSFG